MINQWKEIQSIFVSAGLDVFEKTRVPSWLKNHPAFEKHKKINKVFPTFGLDNFIDKVEYKNDNEEEKTAIIDTMIEDICDKLGNLDQALRNVDNSFKLSWDARKDLSGFRLMLLKTKSAIYHYKIEIINDKMKIKIGEEVKDPYGKTIFRGNESVFKVYGAIDNLMSNLWKKHPELQKFNLVNLPNIDTLPSVKNFHNLNIPNKEYFVVFSGTGDRGSWDISTMSMRGIESCQSWTNPEYSACLIGSILSKYVGIIYLTSGNDHNNLGPKMLYRCIVRFGIDKNNNQKVIILDQMYNSYNETVANLFIDSLRKRTNLQVLDFSPKRYSENFKGNPEEISIPSEQKLQQLSLNEYPYYDLDFDVKKQYNKEKTDLIRDKKKIYTKIQNINSKIFGKTTQEVNKKINEENTNNSRLDQEYEYLVATEVIYTIDHYFNDLIEKIFEGFYNLYIRYNYRHFRVLFYAKMINYINKLSIQDLITNDYKIRMAVNNIKKERIEPIIKETIDIYKKNLKEMLE